MSHYLKYFAVVYFALAVGIILVVYLLNLGVILLIPALIAAAFFSARHFVKKEQRLPNTTEKSTLVWGSTVIAITLGFIALLILVWIHPRTEEMFRVMGYMGRGPNSFLMAAVIAVHGLIFHIAYNGYARYSLSKWVSIERK